MSTRLAAPEVAADVGREEAVDERVGGRVERRQTLDERGHGDHRLRHRDVAVHLQQVEHDVRSPAQDKYFSIAIRVINYFFFFKFFVY